MDADPFAENVRKKTDQELARLEFYMRPRPNQVSLCDIFNLLGEKVTPIDDGRPYRIVVEEIARRVRSN